MEHCDIVILAAGKGTRMESDVPKVLVPLRGRPLISYLLDSVMHVAVKSPIIVVGYKHEQVEESLGDSYQYALQQKQRGTAHAVSAALSVISGNDVLVLYGDMPCIKPETIQQLVSSHSESGAPLTLGTVTVPDFEGWHQSFERFGRIVRSSEGNITGIKEFKDASDEEKKIREVNPAYFVFTTAWLKDNLNNVENNNAQGELYLTDLISIAQKQESTIHSVSIDPREALGANTVEELKILEKIMYT